MYPQNIFIRCSFFNNIHVCIHQWLVKISHACVISSMFRLSGALWYDSPKKEKIMTVLDTWRKHVDICGRKTRLWTTNGSQLCNKVLVQFLLGGGVGGGGGGERRRRKKNTLTSKKNNYVPLSALAKMRKATASFVMSVCPSVHTHNSVSTECIFMKFDFWVFFSKSVQIIQISLNSQRNTGYFTWRPMYIYDISLSSS
jgi:hypothetical protein